MKMHKLNYILLFLLGCTISVSAQDMMRRSYNVNDDVVIDIDAKNTNIIVETWDKNTVEIDAFINDGVPKNEATKIMDSWKLTTNGAKNRVQISSKSDMNVNWNVDISEAELNDALAQLPEIMGPIMNDLVNPLLANISENPLPPDLFENMGAINFDYEAYQEEGDAYLERYEKQVDKKFGKDFEKKMEKWAANFEKNVEGNSKNLENSMEEWGTSFGASMEKWGASFGKKMEAWGKNFEEKMAASEASGQKAPNVIFLNRNREGNKAQKTIKIKAPKNAKFKLDVRYGKIALDHADNLIAELSHSNFKANKITGKDTHVKVSYTPVEVSSWDHGVLNASYVPSCDINTARSIKLISNSSDVNINRLSEVGILSGTFGNLTIKNIGGSFKNLDITLENSDLKLKLPQSAFRFNYNGNQSNVNYPGTLKVDKTSSYDNQIVKGYFKSDNTDAHISILARFSDVLLN